MYLKYKDKHKHNDKYKHKHNNKYKYKGIIELLARRCLHRWGVIMYHWRLFSWDHGPHYLDIRTPNSEKAPFSTLDQQTKSSFCVTYLQRYGIRNKGEGTRG